MNKKSHIFINKIIFFLSCLFIPWYGLKIQKTSQRIYILFSGSSVYFINVKD